MPLGLPKLSSDPVLFLASWLGGFRDYSEHGAAISVVGSPHWRQSGSSDLVVLPSAADYLTTPHSTPLDLAKFSCFAWGLIIDGSGYTIINKSGAGGKYLLYASVAGRIAFADGTTTSQLLGANIGGAGSIGCSVDPGNAPEFYLDGSHIGDGNMAVTVPSNDGAVTIGRQAGGKSAADFSGLLLYDAALSAPEIAQLHAYSQSRFTPRKQWPGGGLRYPDRGTPYTPATGDPLYLDNIQSARITLANQTSGQLSNTGYNIESGTWKLAEDATTGERYIECVVAGIISRRNLEAYGTWEFSVLKGADVNNLRMIPIASVAGAHDASGQDAYQYQYNAAESLSVQRRDAGAFGANVVSTANGYLATDSVRYSIRLTRTAAGLFSMYVLGGAFTAWTLAGSATDNTHTTSIYSVLYLGSGDRLYLDNQTAGVVSPV